MFSIVRGPLAWESSYGEVYGIQLLGQGPYWGPGFVKTARPLSYDSSSLAVLAGNGDMCDNASLDLFRGLGFRTWVPVQGSIRASFISFHFETRFCRGGTFFVTRPFAGRGSQM